MTLEESIYEAIKSRKKSVDYYGNLSDITIEALVKIASRKLGVRVAFSIDRSKGYIFIIFTYPDPEPTPPKQVNNVVTKKAEEKKNEEPAHNSTDKIAYLNDTGAIDFAYQLDVMKGNIIVVHTDYPDNMKDIVKNHWDIVVAFSEGVDYFYWRLSSNVSKDDTMKISYRIHDSYDEFVRRIRLGEEKARNIARELFNGVSCPPELYCMIATGYIQRNVMYNHDYWARAKNKGDEALEIDNHTCYGSLVKGLAVCEGYSWGLIKILRSIGIEAIPVFGYRDGVGHEWTKVKINGNWYNIDSTVDSIREGIKLYAFLVSDDYLRRGGYTFESIKYKATDTRYETATGLINRLNEILSYRDYYASMGVNQYYLYQIYYYYPL